MNSTLGVHGTEPIIASPGRLLQQMNALEPKGVIYIYTLGWLVQILAMKCLLTSHHFFFLHLIYKNIADFLIYYYWWINNLNICTVALTCKICILNLILI